MLSLNQLGTVLSDPELRSMLKSVVKRKLNSDLKTVQAHSELSKRLTNKRAPAINGEDEELREIIKEHLEYYGTLVDLSLNFHQRLIDKLAQSAQAADDPAVNGLTLAMTAPVGATVRAPFKITNNRPEPIRVTCRCSPFVSEDGSQLVASGVAFNPPGAEIAPGSEEIFEAVLPVSKDFVAGRLYLATLSADGFDAMSIVMRLKVEGAVEQDKASGEVFDLGVEAVEQPVGKPAAKKKRAPAKKTAPAKAKSAASAPKKQASRKKPVAKRATSPRKRQTAKPKA